MPLTTETFAALVLEDTDGRREIHRGTPREKPPMSFGHNETAWEIARQLTGQLSPLDYRVRQNAGHLTAGDGFSYVPDVAVVPIALTKPFRDDPRGFEAYSEPLPFVAEVWSPSTGSYDVDAKMLAYRERGDVEIWRVHPFDRTVTIWRRDAGGAYSERIERGGIIALHALPGIQIDLDQLFRTLQGSDQ